MVIKSEKERKQTGLRIKQIRLARKLSMQEFAKLVDPNGKAPKWVQQLNREEMTAEIERNGLQDFEKEEEKDDEQ